MFDRCVIDMVSGISSLVENLVALRYVEHRARSRRLVSVVKVRGSGFDPALREFVIEGDEYDTAYFDKKPKFMHYLPEIAIVASASRN